MSASAVAPAVRPSRLREVTLAGLAEACVLALPLHILIFESGGPSIGVATFAIPFVAVFTGSVFLLSRFREIRNLPLAIGLTAAAVGIAAAGGDLTSIGLSVAASALVTVRAARIAFRGGLDPLHGAIAWGAVGLGVEAMLAAGGGHLQTWRLPLSLLIPGFFIASFGSRAISVWDDPNVEPEDRARWLADARLLSWGFAALMFVGAILGLRGGGLDRLGELVTRGIGWMLYALIRVLLFLAQPIFWLFQRIKLDPDALRRVLDRLKVRLNDAALSPPGTDTGWPWARLLGFVVVVLIAFAAYRSLRRIRPEPEVEAVAGPPLRVSESPLPNEEAARPRGRNRRELPSDRVRRCYAEALLALERNGLTKDGSLTPAEFAPIVADEYPWAREDFGALTRAYEDVRYGGLHPDEPDLRDLNRHHQDLLRALRSRRGPERGGR